jgi:DNA-binding beta-propeller fold protein YncE
VTLRRAQRKTVTALALAASLGWQSAAYAQAAGGSDISSTYRVLVAAESDDQVHLVECTADAASSGSPSGLLACEVARTYAVGLVPADIDGPHGVAASASGRVMYVSIAHGRPQGLLQKYSLETGTALGETELGMFPASLDAGPDGRVYVINFNLHDPDMRPSSLSVVDGGTMLEIARVETCRMPHGSRLSPDGARHYSGCMMDDLLVEVDTRTLAVSRRLSLRDDTAPEAAGGSHAHHPPTCSPTWTTPSPDGTKVYVACNRSAEVVEVDVASWQVTRRWSTPKAPYNMALTPDGRLLVVTQKGPGTTTVWSVADATQLAEIAGTRGIASGVAVSRDGRYAFVTLEGKGGEPGTLDVIDLVRLAKVASVDTGKQAGGVAVVP